MQKFRSSIFSFDTLDMKRGFSRKTLYAVALACAIVFMAEATCRLAFAPLGQVWEFWSSSAAIKFERYRIDVERGVCPDILIVGDSTAGNDISPIVLEEAIPGITAYNLGWNGNFPLAFQQSTLPFFQSPNDVPDVLVVSFLHRSFADLAKNRKSEAGILGSPWCKRARHETTAASYFYLARLQKMREWKEFWFSGLSPDFGPNRKGLLASDQIQELKRPDNSLPSVELSNERFDVIEELVTIARDRNIELVVIVAPRLLPSTRELALESQYCMRLAELAREGQLRWLDCRELDFLKRDHFRDETHLNNAGARLFTNFLGNKLSPLIGSQ